VIPITDLTFFSVVLGWGHLTTLVNCIIHTGSTGQMFANEKLTRMWKETVVVSLSIFQKKKKRIFYTPAECTSTYAVKYSI